VSTEEVLQALVDLAISDEGVYDPEDEGRPISAWRKEVVQAERDSRSQRFGPDELLRRVVDQEDSDDGP